jgi:hypothetical protein
VNVPGTQGDPGENGASPTDGTDGRDAWTTVLEDFVMPAADGTVTIVVGSTAFLPVSPVSSQFLIAVGNAGYMTLISFTSTEITAMPYQSVVEGMTVAAGGTVLIVG